MKMIVIIMIIMLRSVSFNIKKINIYIYICIYFGYVMLCYVMLPKSLSKFFEIASKVRGTMRQPITRPLSALDLIE